MRQSLLPALVPLISQPNTLKESQIDCGGDVLNFVVGILMTKGVESLEKTSNLLSKEASREI